MKRDLETGETMDLKSDLKYIAAAFVVTILMTFFMVLLLPDTPFEFW